MDDETPRGRALPGLGPARTEFAAERRAPRRRSGRRAWTETVRWWFEALDGLALAVGGAPCVWRVVGIHQVRPHLWIQLEAPEAGRGVVVRVTRETPLDEVLAAVAASGPSGLGPQLVEARGWRPGGPPAP